MWENMKKKKNRHLFAICYSVVLTAGVAFVLLDTFVIPKSVQKVTQTESSDVASGSAVSSDDAAVITDNSYSDDNIKIKITEDTEYNTKIYKVDIQLSDIKYLKTAFAQSTYGRNIKETTSEMAEDVNAILAINGDYYGFRDYGYVIRNSVLYRDTAGDDSQDLAIMSDGSFKIFDESETSASDILSAGALQVLSFGPALVENSKVVVDESTEVSRAMQSNPRTAIGMISPLHYEIIVSDGRTSESEGLSLYQLAGIFESDGVSVAYNLDGGGSSTLVFNGNVINNPTDGHGSGEREVSDILYIG